MQKIQFFLPAYRYSWRIQQSVFPDDDGRKTWQDSTTFSCSRTGRPKIREIIETKLILQQENKCLVKTKLVSVSV